MRILLAGKFPPAGGAAFGGVASWMQTVADVLSLRGHECVFWGPKLPIPSECFDVGVIANAYSVRRIFKRCERVICVSHGIISEERPPPAYRSVFTSEEVRDHWAGNGAIVRQPIDLRFWNDRFREPERMLLLYSYRAPDDFGLERVARRLGFRFVHLRKATHRQARDMMLSASIVCASGRAALEAMACGAPTVICDYRPYNSGPLICSDLKTARAHNYSGRGGLEFTAERAIEAILSAEKMQTPREYVIEHHDAARIAGEILEAALC
jgi:glycosyltransferase involved in cell wall biosynthesis